MKYLNFLLSNSPLKVAFKLLSFIGQKSRSTPHESLLKYNKDNEARPIFLLGFARSGTTTFQRVLSDIFAYNTSFEPIGFNHSNWNKEAFSQISAFFHGAPRISELPFYQLGGAPFSTIHCISNTAIRDQAFSLLKKYIKHLLNHYGNNIVIKEVRLIPNLTSIAKISENIEVKPIFIFLTCNPFMPLYTYYRLGGLIETNDVENRRVNEIFEYHKITYTSLGMFPDILGIKCHNKFDKLLLSIILDQKYMQFYADRNPDSCFVVDFEESISSIDEIAAEFALPKKGSISVLLKNPRRYEQDYLFLKRLRAKTNPELLSLIEDLFSYRLEEVPKASLNYRIWITFLRQKILEFSKNSS